MSQSQNKKHGNEARVVTYNDIAKDFQEDLPRVLGSQENIVFLLKVFTAYIHNYLLDGHSVRLKGLGILRYSDGKKAHKTLPGNVRWEGTTRPNVKVTLCQTLIRKERLAPLDWDGGWPGAGETAKESR